MTAADEPVSIVPVGDGEIGDAVALLRRFLAEEGFATQPSQIAGNLRASLGDGIGWAALAVADGRAVGVATVQVSRSIELGLPAEVGDLYVEFPYRGRGAARALVEACCDWAAAQGSGTMQVTLTAECEHRHGLGAFYARLGFADEGRTLRMRPLQPTGPALRLAGIADLGAAQRIVREAYAPYVSRLGREPAPLVDDYRTRIARAELWLADVDAQAAGLIVLEARADHLLLDNVAVASACRRRGIGRSLIAFAEREARRRGYLELRLYTHLLMTENQAIYRRLGFSETHRSETDGLPRIHFVKALA